MSECLFCRIVAGEVPSRPVAESERAYAFHDIAPQAPVHVLVIPKAHITSADEVAGEHGGIVDDLVLLAQRVVAARGRAPERLPPRDQRRRGRPDDRAAPARARPRRDGDWSGRPDDLRGRRRTTAQTVTTYVPNTHLMSGLLGPRDEYLRVVERAYPQCKIRVQGNRISVEGADAAKVLRLFDELVLVLESGQSLDPSKVTRTIDMVEDDLRPSEVLRHEVVRGAKGKPVRPSTAGPEALHRRDRRSTITFAIGPAGTGKSYLAVAAAVQALHRRQVQRIVLTRPGRRGGRAPRLPARGPHGQGRPLPATALRRPLRHGRRRGRPAPDRQRDHRDRAARVHARAHAERLVHHPRRGAEHDARADEDVPHAHRVQLQGRRHRRRDPDRPRRQAQRARSTSSGSWGTSRGSASCTWAPRTSCATSIVADIVAAYERETP